MPQQDSLAANIQERIFAELTFIGEHLIYLEKILQLCILRLGEEPPKPPSPLRR